MTAPSHRLAVAAVALALSAAPVYAAESKNIDKTLPLSATGTVTLDAHNGTIQVKTWDRKEVEVHVRIEARGLTSYDRSRFDATTVDIAGSADRVSIKSRPSDLDGWSLWSLFGVWGDNPDVRYTITAPRTAQWKIRDHNANADIRDVHAALAVATHNGSVRVSNLSGPLELSMHNGYANVDFASFAASRIASHNGTVELALPASSKFNFHSSGHNMHVHSDFPVSVQSANYRERDVEGSVNGGGPRLDVVSHNGGFSLRSK